MKIQFLNGGLANQTFQYIFARYYELSHPGNIMYMDDTYFALHTVHNGYELEKVFGLKPHMLSECFDEEVWRYILEEKRSGKSVPEILCNSGIEIYMLAEVEPEEYKRFNPFDGKAYSISCGQYMPDILDLPGDVYYHGYWINKDWFLKYRDIFLQELRFSPITDDRNLRYQEQIKSSDSVAVHVRRGDYVTIGCCIEPKEYATCTKKFAEEVVGDWHLFVFSDDIPWCREHEETLGFRNFSHITYVEGNTAGESYRDLQLMSMCRAMIVSNSAFCYLAGLLNTEKKYIVNMVLRGL